MLKTESLQVCYGDFIAVSSVSMEISSGQIAALIGANGSGKTTLLSAIAGLEKVCSGHVYFENEDITNLSAPERVKRGLSLVPQGGRCFPRMSVEDNLLMGAYLPASRRKAKQSLEHVYHLFPDLILKRKSPAGSLSGGQRQMVAIGRAMMSLPKCLLFDEISLGLAPIVIGELYSRILEINRSQGTTIVLVEQDTTRALSASNLCLVMLKGKIALSGATDQLDSETIRSSYFGV